MIPSMLLHPSDETLSRVADQSDTERMRTRAGRHAARCARCGALVAEYVALGEAARRIEPTAPPPSLAERIGHIPPTSGVASGAPDSVSVPRARGRRRGRTIGLAAAAAVVIAIALAWPALRQRELAAADANALTITPRYPRAGTTAQVRFVPPAGMPATDTLWLEGELRVAGPGGTWDDDALVGMALVRDGSAYVARLPIPPGTLTGRLEVVDTRWPPMQQRPIGSTILLAAGPAGSAPSLDALEASAFAPAFGTSRATVAAEFARWAPNHPLRWVLEPGRSNGGAFDWLGYFTSKERRYARLTRALRDRPALRAGELAGMALLAYDIEEPASAAEWTARLLREHPDSPWSLDMLTDQIHAMELREAPRDSILALMPLLDAQLARADFVPGNPWNLRAIVERNGDSAMLHRWSLRMARVGLRSMDLVGRQEDLRDPELRDSAEAGARLMLARIAPIRGPTAQRTRAYSYSILASVALARGDYRRAIALTDSTRVGRCIWAGEATRALAFLALGDTASAERHLLPYAKAEWSGADTVRRLLGARVRDPHWLTAVDSTFRERNACRAKEQGLD